MSTQNPNNPIIELRVALITSDYERLAKFYCDGLGIEPEQIWNNDGGRALILNMGYATLEIFDETQARAINQIEAGQRISGQIRFALQVPDLKAAIAEKWKPNCELARLALHHRMKQSHWNDMVWRM